MVSPEVAHISVPIEVTPIAKQVRDVYKFSNELSDLAYRLGTDSQGGLYCKMLSYTCDQKLSLLNNKLETIIFFLTQHEEYNSNEVLGMIQKRSIPLDHILPDHSVAQPMFEQPRLSLDTWRLLNRGFKPVPGIQKKSLVNPDDTGSGQSNTTVAEPNQTNSTMSYLAYLEWLTGGAPSTTSTTPPPTILANTTVAPNITLINDHISWQEMHQGSPNKSGDTINPVSPGPQPLDITDPFDHFTQDEFFQNTEYPELYRASWEDQFFKRSVPDPESELTLNRVTRQVFSIVVSLLASVGVASIFGGVTAAQIDSIKATESRLTSNQAMIIHQLDANSKSILVNRNLVDSLGNLTIKLAQFSKELNFESHGMLLFAIMTAEFEQIEDSLDTYVAIIESANQGNYHPAILGQEAAVAAYENVVAKAELKGLKPIINTAQQFAQLDTHYSFSPKGIKIIIELPLISSGNSFELYEFKALPIELGPAAYLYLVSEVPMIAIGEADQTGKSTFVEMTHDALSHCKRLGQIHICDKQRVIKKSTSDSCIYSLYLSDHEQAELLCRASVEKKDQDLAIAIGPNRFAYYSLHPSTYFFRCQNGSTSQSMQLTGITEIQVPVGCVAETAQFVLHSQIDILLETHPKHFTWSQPALDMLGNGTSYKSVEEVLDAYTKARAIPKLDAKTHEDFMEKQKPFYLSPAPFSAVALSTTAILLVLSVIFYILWKLRRARQKAEMLADPRVRMRNLLENNERLELLEQLLADRREGQAQMQLM